MRRLALLIVCVAAVCSSTLPALSAPAPDTDKWALIIGVDHHQGGTRSNVGAVGDANLFKRLVTQHGWPEDHIRMLTDSAATQAAIRQGLQWMVDNCGPSSKCVVHYSGHTKQMNPDGNEGPHEYLWPSDNLFISDTELAGYVERFRGLTWVDIAACEAAGFDNGISSPRRLFTAASQENEKGYEDPSWATSVWTGLLVERAMLGHQADNNGDGHVSLTEEAIPWATERAPQHTVGQSHGPQHPYRAGGEETNFFPPEPAPAAAAAPKVCFLLIFC